MTEKILQAAGILAYPGRAADPPDETYAIYFDDVEADGPDGLNMIFTHDITVELYEPALDDVAEAAMEAELNAQGIPWSKQARYWLKDTQRYQVIYEFSYIEKRGVTNG